jgi:hypothetical protein
MKENKMYWFNFVTDKYEYIETSEDLSDYVPQIGGRALYQILVEQKGKNPIDAALEVLSLAIDEKP